jgi:DNA-binding transcriptional ArsR family regulator
MSNDSDNYIIRSKRQMRALAASTRQEILDVLPRMGTVSIAELAAALGRPADSLYYHLRILRSVGLVLSEGYRAINGRREALIRAVAPEMSLCYELGKKGNGSEVNAIIASMLRLGMRDFSSSFKAGQASVSGPERELWALRKVGSLSLAQISAVNRYIEHLMRVMADTNPNGQLYALTVVLTPLYRKGTDRQKPG